MLVIFTGIILFYILVLAGVIPFAMVWGGRLGSRDEMQIFETISIVVNFLIITVVAIKGGYIKSFVPRAVVTVFLWALVILFSLNTVGNLLSNSFLEAIIFTPLTLMAAVFCYRLAVEKPR